VLSFRLRFAAVACGLLVVVIHFSSLFAARTQHAFVAWTMVNMMLALVVPFGLWAALAWRDIRAGGVIRLDPEAGRFVVGGRALQAFIGIGIFNFVATSPLFARRVPHTDRMRLVADHFTVTLAAIQFVIVAAVAVYVITVDRPRLLVDATGMTINRAPMFRRRIAWDDIVSGSVTLVGGHPVTWRSKVPGQVTSLPLFLGVPRPMLMHAVRTYVDQPDRRGEAGTAAGLERLTRELTAATPMPVA
jgi:hypothetical protein